MPGRVHPIFTFDSIKVTDLPRYDAAGVNFIRYNYLPEDPLATQDFTKAGVAVGAHADRHREFWKGLAFLVADHRLARCHGCTAYAAKTLFDKGFHTANNLNIWICGRGDHYFLILSAAAGLLPNTQNLSPADFGVNDVVVDVWTYNVVRQTQGVKSNAALACTVGNCAFIAGTNDIRTFVRYN